MPPDAVVGRPVLSELAGLVAGYDVLPRPTPAEVAPEWQAAYAWAVAERLTYKGDSAMRIPTRRDTVERDQLAAALSELENVPALARLQQEANKSRQGGKKKKGV